MTTAQIKSKIEELTLIDGSFSHDEAKDILVQFLSSKIKFHQHKNFSSLERFGKEDKVAQKRIPELKKELARLNEFLLEAAMNNKKLVISSVINISLSEEM